MALKGIEKKRAKLYSSSNPNLLFNHKREAINESEHLFNDQIVSYATP